MAHVVRFLFVRHLRSDQSCHVLRYRAGTLATSARGASFWFIPLSTSIAEVPCDDREQAFLFHARTSDYQDVTTQGVITYRVSDPERAAQRIDFSIDSATGAWKHTPLEQIGHQLTQLAQQFTWGYVAQTPVVRVLAEGITRASEEIRKGFAAHDAIADMGLSVIAIRVTGVAPTPDLEKALQTPTREQIQQQADEATFQRRAMAVEKERAIQENEIQTKIEIAKRQESLIGQEGQNERRKARERAEAAAIATDAAAARRRVESAAHADGLRTVGAARTDTEAARMAVYKELPSHVLMSVAARRFASKLHRIDHLNVAPDLLGPLLANLAQAGAKKLASDPGRAAEA